MWWTLRRRSSTYSQPTQKLSRRINKNFAALRYESMNGRRGVVLEGGSRSGKTYSGIHFIVYLCAANRGEPLTINIVKETYNSFKTTLYDDFNRVLNQIHEPSPFDAKDVQSFRLWGNKINFLGADQPSKFHGASCDYFFINEALDVKQAFFDQLEMRCRNFWWMDFNPKCSEHWIFNILGKRDDVKFVHSTMMDNPFIGEWEKKKIAGYEPNEANIASGTADDYLWKVYGLGLRASPQGLVFPNVTWIDAFPENIERISYGMDFGYTNSPTAITRVGKDGNNLYAELLFYHPTDNSSDLAKVIERMNIGDAHLWADSADPGMIADLRLKGIRCLAVGKFPGSVRYGIDLIKQHKIHLVRNADARREAENYKWREVGGIRLNEPAKEFDHFFDSLRYACLMEFRR